MEQTEGETVRLTELLTRITPLPHQVRKGDLHFENLVADVRGVTIFGKYKAVRAIDDAVYQAHAANVLPALVEALQSIKSNMDADNEKSYRGDDPEGAMESAFAIAEAALAAAEEVKEL